MLRKTTFYGELLVKIRAALRNIVRVPINFPLKHYVTDQLFRCRYNEQVFAQQLSDVAYK